MLIVSRESSSAVESKTFSLLFTARWWFSGHRILQWFNDSEINLESAWMLSQYSRWLYKQQIAHHRIENWICLLLGGHNSFCSKFSKFHSDTMLSLIYLNLKHAIYPFDCISACNISISEHNCRLHFGNCRDFDCSNFLELLRYLRAKRSVIKKRRVLVKHAKAQGLLQSFFQLLWICDLLKKVYSFIKS